MPDTRPPKRVLVVDDETIFADTLALILRAVGYDAEPFYNAEAALGWCCYNRPDVVITNVVVGGMNGIGLAKRLADFLPDFKVLLVSGQVATAPLIQDSISGGYRLSILAKPVHPLQKPRFPRINLTHRTCRSQRRPGHQKQRRALTRGAPSVASIPDFP
jgi:DNA-binding NtrC family response regulator